MSGDIADVVSRLSAALPKRWFSEQQPVVSAILKSIATSWVWVFDLIDYAKSQVRLATATDDWLDMISYDYFGSLLKRRTNESDPSFRSHIQLALFREAATRAAVSSGLAGLTGKTPIVFEPANCMDTGSYGSLQAGAGQPGTGLAYGQIGGWGSLQLPLQFFIIVARPSTPGVSMVAGYGTSNGGYGGGFSGYVDLSLLPGYVTDQDIRTTLSSLLPVNTTAWLRIT